MKSIKSFIGGQDSLACSYGLFICAFIPGRKRKSLFNILLWFPGQEDTSLLTIEDLPQASLEIPILFVRVHWTNFIVFQSWYPHLVSHGK